MKTACFIDMRPEMRCKVGAFVRIHRERIAPESMGLLGSQCRPSPGLRREDREQLLRVIDVMLSLPEPLEMEFADIVSQIQEDK